MDGMSCDQEGPEGGTSRDPVDNLLGRVTTGSSRLFIRTAGLVIGDRNTGYAGELGGESTSIGVQGFPSGKPLSLNWFG